MKIINKKIELTRTEKAAFERQYKLSILYQLHIDKLLTYEQLEQISKALEIYDSN